MGFWIDPTTGNGIYVDKCDPLPWDGTMNGDGGPYPNPDPDCQSGGGGGSSSGQAKSGGSGSSPSESSGSSGGSSGSGSGSGGSGGSGGGGGGGSSGSSGGSSGSQGTCDTICLKIDGVEVNITGTWLARPAGGFHCAYNVPSAGSGNGSSLFIGQNGGVTFYNDNGDPTFHPSLEEFYNNLPPGYEQCDPPSSSSGPTGSSGGSGGSSGGGGGSSGGSSSGPNYCYPVSVTISWSYYHFFYSELVEHTEATTIGEGGFYSRRTPSDCGNYYYYYSTDEYIDLWFDPTGGWMMDGGNECGASLYYALSGNTDPCDPRGSYEVYTYEGYPTGEFWTVS